MAQGSISASYAINPDFNLATIWGKKFTFPITVAADAIPGSKGIANFLNPLVNQLDTAHHSLFLTILTVTLDLKILFIFTCWLCRK